MNNSENFDSSDIVSQQKSSQLPISLDDFKALYYFMNAKSDTDIRLLSKEKVVELADIFVSVFIAGQFLGKNIESFIDRKINDFEDYPKFFITRGDKNSIHTI